MLLAGILISLELELEDETSLGLRIISKFKTVRQCYFGEFSLGKLPKE
jgi:hypothetical protein